MSTRAFASEQVLGHQRSSSVGARARSIVTTGRLIDWLVLALIVVVAAATRLTYLDFVEFKDDEAKVMALAVEFLKGNILPLVGIVSSVGVNNPPAYIYLMAIPLAISRDPAVATGFVGLLGVGAVLLCYRLCLELFGKRVAQVAALLYAAAPWGVLLSRKAQAQDVIPFFTLLLVAGLFRFARGDGNRHLVAAVVWLNVLIQLHLGGIALAPLVAIVALVNWRRLRTAGILVAGGLTALLWLPYLVFQLTHDWVDLRIALGAGNGAPETSLAHVRWIVEMAATNAYWGYSGPSFSALYRIEEVLFYAGLILLTVLAYRSVRWNRADQRYLILALWLVIPPLFWVRHSTALYPHYFQTVVPIQFILIGLVLSKVEDLTRRIAPRAIPSLVGQIVRVGGGLLVLALVATQSFQFFGWQSQIVEGSTPPGYGAPLRDRKAFVERAIEINDSSHRPVYLAANGSDYRSALEYLVAGRLNLKTFDDRDTLLAPPADGGETLYLVSNPTWFAGRFLRQYLPERLVATVPHAADDQQFEIYRLGAADRDLLLSRSDPRSLGRVLPNGVRFLGYIVPARAATGAKLSATLFWQVDAPPPAKANYGYFFHLVDDRGSKVAQVDGLNYLPVDWRPGDLVATEALLDVPAETTPGRYWLEAGAYQRPDLTRLPQRAPNGSESDRSRLGPIRIDTVEAAAAPAPSRVQTAALGSNFALVGYDIDAAKAVPGGELGVALFWRANAVPDFDYSTFAHLVDAEGRLVAQSDGQPGVYPTTLWQPAETIRDERQVALPSTLATGTYRLRVGLYRSDTGARLPTNTEDDYIALDLPITIR